MLKKFRVKRGLQFIRRNIFYIKGIGVICIAQITRLVPGAMPKLKTRIVFEQEIIGTVLKASFKDVLIRSRRIKCYALKISVRR